MKHRLVCLWQVCISQTAHDSFAAWTVVLKRFAIAQRIVKSEFVDNSFQIIKPELGNEFRVASCALSLRHLTSAFLIELDADRGRSLNDRSCHPSSTPRRRRR